MLPSNPGSGKRRARIAAFMNKALLTLCPSVKSPDAMKQLPQIKGVTTTLR
jgi:hypothetical protein